MKTGKELAKAACAYLGRTYDEMDCQKFVETALADIGIKKDLPGSNSWFREVMQNGWVGTPEECVKKNGSVPTGAFLFILEQNGKEPEKFRNDGIGNASHIGLVTNMTGEEMVNLSGNATNGHYNFGGGAIHSSASRGHVATSKFSGRTINGGWNRVGLWNHIDYGVQISASTEISTSEAVSSETATVYADSGNTVNLRKGKSTSANLVNRIPVGSMVKILNDGSDWSKVSYTDSAGAVWCGWIMTRFIKTEKFVVCIPFYTLTEAQAMIEKYPGSWIDSGVG